MKIFIRTDGVSFTIPIPYSFLTFVLRHGADLINSVDDGDKDYEKLFSVLYPLACELKQARRVFGHLELVHINSSDGDEVIISL